MSFFDLFKKKQASNAASTDNGKLGPTYLESVTEHIEDAGRVKSFEWKRSLISNSSCRLFRIHYFGDRHEEYGNLIVSKGLLPVIIVAIPTDGGEGIVLFDGCRHGYNALLGEEFSPEVVNGRHADQLYVDKKGEETFEVVISVYNQGEFDDEYADQVDENGMIEVATCDKIPFNQLKRDAFDVIQIKVRSKDGRETEILSEELA